MANTIELAKKYTTLLDEEYRASSKTSILDAPAGLVQEVVGQANTFLIPSISLQGLGDYGRNTGYVDGDVDFSYESHTLTQDRGRKFQIDYLDQKETIGTVLGAVTGQFLKQKVIPEIDAYRIATMAGLAGNVATPATLDKTTVDEAISLGKTVMSEAEVNTDDRILFITPTVLTALENSDLFTKNIDGKAAGSRDKRIVGTYDGMMVVEIPQTRMYTALTIYDGSTAGQEAGGYIKNATTGKDINFMIVSKSAVLGITSHATLRIFDPMQNINYDGWQIDYRIYHDLFVPGNKNNITS